MGEQVKPLLIMPAFYIGAVVQVLAALLSIKFPANSLWKAADDGPSAWDLATYVGDPEETPGSWIRPGPALVVAAIWGASQRMEDLSVSVSSSL